MASICVVERPISLPPFKVPQTTPPAQECRDIQIMRFGGRRLRDHPGLGERIAGRRGSPVEERVGQMDRRRLRPALGPPSGESGGRARGGGGGGGGVGRGGARGGGAR